MRNVGFTAILSLLIICSSASIMAQTAQNRWAAGLGGTILKYQAPGNGEALLASPYNYGATLMVGRYLAGGFDFFTQAIYSPSVNYPIASDATLKSALYDMNYNLVFKINNGVFLKESSFVGPFLRVGIGGSYVQNNPDGYIPLGGGLRIRLGQKSSIRIESVKRISLNKDYQHLSHSMAFVYNFGQKKEVVPSPAPVEEKKPLLATTLIPEDTIKEEIVATEVEKSEVAEDTIISVAVNQPQPDTNTTVVEVEAVPEEKPTPPAPVVAEIILEEKKPVQEEPAEPVGIVYVEEEKKTLPPTPPTIPKPEIPTERREINTFTSQKEVVRLPCGDTEVSDSQVNPIYFETGSETLPDKAKEILTKIAMLMKSCERTELVLHGHTDAVGSSKDNLVLSIMRAFNVKYYLVYEHGISQRRIRSQGFGEDQPISNNETNLGREKNRRVDFQLIF